MIILLAIYSIVIVTTIGVAIWAMRAADQQLKRHQDALRVPSLAQAMEASRCSLRPSPLASTDTMLGRMNEPAFSQPVKTWEIELRVNGTDILTIGSGHLCGINNIDDYADTVRMAAEHLLAFIGLPAPSREDIDHGRE